MLMDQHERAALEGRYQQLYEQTARIEKASHKASCSPAEMDPTYSSLSRELEVVTLQLSRSH